MTVIRPNSISGINSITAQVSALNFYDSAGAALPVTAGAINVDNINATGVSTFANATIAGGSITGVSTIGVTTVTATNLTVNGNAYPTAGPLSNRNLIIIGAMQVAQKHLPLVVKLFTIPSISGKTIGSSNFLQVAFGQYSNTGTTAWELNITGVQLEAGTVATPFEHRSYGDELARCQRYYCKLQGGGTNVVYGIGWNRANDHTRTLIQFPKTMRTAPTALETTGTASDYVLRHTNNNTVCSNVPTFQETATRDNVILTFETSGGLTAGQCSGGASANTTSYLAFSAEL
jgi:hypothetical protein